MGDGAIEIRETHSAVVLFVGDRAYKWKKAVDLGFLDFSTLRRRREACVREVNLNRRLAPDVYLGVGDVIGPDGLVCEHLVVMRRMPGDRRLSSLAVGDGDAVDLPAAMRDLGARLASFHRRALRTSAAEIAAGTEATRVRWDDLLRRSEELGDDAVDARIAELRRLAHRYLDGRDVLFERRIAEGRARDGHGDLLADDIFLLDDGPRILDCLDFDDRLRGGDVVADIAFLTMDLERLGRPDLAAAFVASYLEASGDEWPPSLLHHHVAERAVVRALVTLVRHRQEPTTDERAAIDLLDLAARHLHAGRVRLVAVGGPPGSGKSTLSAGLASRLGAELLRTDDVRGDVRPRLGADERYTPRAVAATYGLMMERAARLLGDGRSVVLDATWRDPVQRVAVEALADATVADLTAFECSVPAEVADERIRSRRRDGVDPSEATVGVAEAMRRAWVPWEGATRISSEGPLEATTAAALQALDADATAAARTRTAT
jgi:hypothetical protein